jgi:hypothetical protein
MSEKALQPLEQKTVIFYDDEITAVLVAEDKRQEVYVPVRPICDFLGIDWSSQRRRINRDPVLSEVTMSVVITATDIDPKSRRPQTSSMLCLPLDFLNGWLFGVSAQRVKSELRERVITYQRECYKILSDAFQETYEEQTAITPNIAALQQVKALGQALINLAEEQIEQEIRLSQTEQRLDQAVVVVGDLTKRVEAVEGQLGDPGRKVTPGQATSVSQAVKAVAMALSKASGRNEYGGVYGELYRRYEVPSYRELPASKYEDVMAWLNEWLQSMSSDQPF